jgi:amidase
MSIERGRLRGFLVPPGTEDVARLADLDGVELQEGEAPFLQAAIRSLLESASLIEEISPPSPRTMVAHRDPGYRPTGDEDPLNLFIRKVNVYGSEKGPLEGDTIGLKDNISVAGIPTTNGSRLFSHTPTLDAVVVERILSAGGRIVGKLNMDDFGAAGTGETSAFGPCRNPVNINHSPGGSSGASAAAVRAGAVDLALGVDQGGSGRIPAAACGVVGLKATHGLVPSFGVTHIDHTIDFVTPITKSVADAARLLEVIAGFDDRDPQWVRGSAAATPFKDVEHEGVSGLRIGVIEESMGNFCDKAVIRGVDASVSALKDTGASVETISIPIWSNAITVFQPYIACLFANMYRTEGEGYGHLGYVDADRAHAFGLSRRTESQHISPQAKAWIIAARHIQEKYLNVPFWKLHNARLWIRSTLSGILENFDLLITPTVPSTAPRLLDPPVETDVLLTRTDAKLCFNTSPLNLTGQPALALPSGVDQQGLPTSVQIIGRHFDERTVLRAGFELERSFGIFGGSKLDPAVTPTVVETLRQPPT